MAGSLRNRGVLVAILVAAVVGAGEPAQANDVGFVLDIAGQWALDGGPTEGLRVGQAVPGGGTIRARASQPRWRIVVALSDGTTLKRICNQTVAACGEPLVLPSATQKQTSAWDRALAAASALFAHPSERYASTMSRGGAGAADGVVKLEDDAVHLDRVLSGLPAGAYSLTLRARRGGPAKAIPGLSFQAPVGGPLRAAGLTPGLYDLVVTPRTEAEDSSTAWVLIVEPAAFAATQDAYESAQTTAHGWDADVRQQAVRAFLRAYLEGLASHLATSVGSGEPTR